MDNNDVLRDSLPNMLDFLKNNDVEVKNDFIKIEDNIKHIKIDVGVSHLAPHTRHWLKNEKDLLVFSFEPRLDCVKLLKESHIEGSVVVPCALSDVENPTLMNFNVTKNLNDDDGGASSLFNLTDNFSKKQLIKERIVVPVFNLKMFLELIPWGTNGIEYIEYIKIDAQGADINVIKGAGDIIKDRVVYITAEPDGHVYKDASGNNINNIAKYMKEIGFIHVNHHNTKDPTFLNKKFIHLKDSVYILQKDWWLNIGPNCRGNGSDLIGKSDIPFDKLFY
jgi:FkbM family methyltransferase